MGKGGIINMKQKENRLVVYPGGNSDIIPEWIFDEIKMERMMSGFANILGKNNGPDTVGDAEICAYLYTASLSTPMTHEYSEIYIYLVGRLMKRKQNNNKNGNLPDFMEKKLEQGLTQDEERMLRILREEIYRKRGGEIQHPLFDVLKELKKTCKGGNKNV